MKNITSMSMSELEQRIAVLCAVKNSLEFSGRILPDGDAGKLSDLKAELSNRQNRL